LYISVAKVFATANLEVPEEELVAEELSFRDYLSGRTETDNRVSMLASTNMLSNLSTLLGDNGFSVCLAKEKFTTRSERSLEFSNKLT
jgi:hypothetical protein